MRKALLDSKKLYNLPFQNNVLLHFLFPECYQEVQEVIKHFYRSDLAGHRRRKFDQLDTSHCFKSKSEREVLSDGEVRLRPNVQQG